MTSSRINQPCKPVLALSISIAMALMPLAVERSSMSVQSASVKVRKLNSDGLMPLATFQSRFSGLKDLLLEQLGQYGLSQPDFLPKQEGSLRVSMAGTSPGTPLEYS